MTKEYFDNENKDEKQEKFCASCLTVPIALAAGGGGIAAGSGAIDKQKHKTLKKTLFIFGITIAVLSILYSCYVLYKQKKDGGLAVCSR